MVKDYVVEEQYGTTVVRRYKIFGENKIAEMRPFDNTTSSFSLKEFFREVFLPQGYPLCLFWDSVTEDYLEYQLWDTLQAFASSITGSLATEAVLKGVGVGDQSATVLAATMTWLLRDGTGMLGRIIFAWARGMDLDADSKKWRLFADVINDFALFLDLMAPHFKAIFIPIVCISSVARSLVGVAGGATRAALTQHQSRRNNLADVSAKDGSQETLVNLSALFVSFILIPAVSGNYPLIWLIYCLLTILHLYANYLAVSILQMDTVNRLRYRILLSRYLLYREVLDIKSVNKQEPFVQDFLCLRPKVTLKLGCSLQTAFVPPAGATLFQSLSQSVFQGRDYLVNVISKDHGRFTVAVVLNTNASSETLFESAFCALTVEELLSRGNYPGLMHFDAAMSSKHHAFREAVEQLLKECAKYTEAEFPVFFEKLKKKKWNTTYSLLNFDEYRVHVRSYNSSDLLVDDGEIGSLIHC